MQEELELTEKTPKEIPKETQIEKQKEMAPIMQVTLGNKTFLNLQHLRQSAK